MNLHEILDNLLNDDTFKINEEMQELLDGNKKECVERLLPILKQGVKDVKGGKTSNFHRLAVSILLLAYFEEELAYSPVFRLLAVDSHTLVDILDELDFSDGIGGLLAFLSPSHLNEFKQGAANGSLAPHIRKANIEALHYLIGMGEFSRDEGVAIFKNILTEALDGVCTESGVIQAVIDSLIELWPSECIEEIREVLGRGLVDAFYLDAQTIDATLAFGYEKCMLDHENYCDSSIFLCYLFEDDEELEVEEEVELVIDKDLLAILSLDDCEIHSDETLFCGDLNDEAFIELAKLDEALNKSPEHAVWMAENLVARYPESPLMYEGLYLSYTMTTQMQESIEILKKAIVKFPQNLAMRIEYGQYFLRRGEPAKTAELFSNKFTLQEFFPERKSYHLIEFLGFTNLMVSYFLSIHNPALAKAYMSALKEVAPESTYTEEAVFCFEKYRLTQAILQERSQL